MQDNEATQTSSETRDPRAASAVLLVPLEEIETNPFQPRSDFDEEALRELAESIRVQGIIQPVTVRRTGAKSYQLISGERRLRASRMAGLTEIPAYIRSADDTAMLELALIENIQRENLNAIEIAISYQRMIEECQLGQEELGGRVGKNRSTVTNYLRLLKLPPVIQAAIRDERISMGHARALINVNEVDRQLWIYQQILEKGLSVRKVEELVRSMTEAPVKKEKRPERLPYEYGKIADGLSSKFGTKVQLRIDGAGKGKIEIPVLSRNDLNRILDILG
ncbi:MAG TPA: ParB/RepB/Spo0J family partition protein [Anseongella sp.]|nr:ParB/RepB/Spo0J family partition protein [Anseongella sp.]